MGKPGTDSPRWKRMSFKGNKVWVERAPNGSLRMENQKVRIKYNLMQDHEYWIRLDNLRPEDQAVPASDAAKGKTVPPPDQLPDNTICIFVEGVGGKGPASGMGILLKYGPHRKQISKTGSRAGTTIAQIRAVEQALLSLKRRDLPVRIYTTATHAVNLIRGKKQAKTHTERVERLQALAAQFRDLEWMMVKKKSGFKEVGLAAYLAASAMNSPTGEVEKKSSPAASQDESA